MPSRGTIFSGRQAHCGPVPGFYDVWKVNAPSIATILNDAGYRTVYVGKWHCDELKDQMPESVKNDRDRFPGCGVRVPEDRRAGFQEWYGFDVIHNNRQSYVWKNHDMDPTLLNGSQTDALTDLAIDYLNNVDSGQSLYLVLSIEPPHPDMGFPKGHAHAQHARIEGVKTEPT